MSDSDPKIWCVNRTPRFSVLELAEYMVNGDDSRETIRRNSKYERIAPATLYSEVHRAVARYLASPIRDRKILEACRASLQGIVETANNPQRKENATYALRALEAFERSLNALPIGGIKLEHSPIFPVRIVSGVKLSVQPTVLAKVIRPRGKDLRGAILIDYAKGTTPKSEELKAKATDSMTHAAILLHDHVATLVTEEERASPDHCIVFHTYRQELVSAPTNYRKVIKNIEAACRVIAAGWDDIEPPTSFDPKRARYRD